MRGIITIIGWKRPYYLKNILDSILNAYNFENYDFHISIDYHPNTRDKHIEVINDFKLNITTNVFVELQNHNIGNTGNTRRSCDFAFVENNYDYMIHLEDDTIVGEDCLLWNEWVVNNYKNDPECFCFCPFTTEDGLKQIPHEYKNDITNSFKKYWFDSQGGFTITKNQYQIILEDGGIFGAAWNIEPSTENREIWKNSIHQNDLYAFDGAMNYYFRNNKYTISPFISRTNNIGELEGKWNPGKVWHNEHVLNSIWIESNIFDNLNKEKISYKLIE